MKTHLYCVTQNLSHLLLGIACCWWFCGPHAGAAEIAKANNTTGLNQTGAWVGGVVPGPNDIAVWSNNVASAANCTNSPGSDLYWLGIKVLSIPATAQVASGSNPVKTMTLGAGGINMNEAATSQDFNAMTQFAATNSQTWSIKAGRAFRFNKNADVVGDIVVTLSGPGTFEGTGSADAVMRVGAGSSGTAIVNQTDGLFRGNRSGSGAVLLNIGRFAGNKGVYNLIAGTIDTDDNTAGSLIRIGDEAGAEGVLNVSGGQVNAIGIDLGNSGTGTLNLSGSGVVTASGTITMPRTLSATGVVNLNGGLFTMGKATALAGGAGIFNFNGGTLKPAAAAIDFMQNLTAAYVKEGGARVDTAGLDVTIAQPLLHGGIAAVDGGLTKSGYGTLTLSGAGSFNGPTLVQEGKLVLTTGHAGGGAISVADNAVLGVQVVAPGTTLQASALTLGTSSGASSQFNLSVLGNPTAPVIRATNLTTHGTVVVDVSGVGLAVGQFPLIQYSGTIGGSGYAAFLLSGLPLDVSASLVNNPANSSVDLLVTAAPKLIWTAAVSGTWDIMTTTNWVDTLGRPTYYTDGYPVVFDDTALSGSVDVSTSVSPGGTTVSNNALAYTLGGFGQITGGGPLRKEGTGNLTLSTLNSYSGDTVVQAGTLSLGVEQAIPGGTGNGNVKVEGTLDLAGFNDAINGLTGAGVVDNSSATPASISVGGNNASGTFSGTIRNTAGPLSVTKSGSGTFYVLGNNTYSGGTSNTAGTLKLGHDNALGTGLVRLSGGTLTSDGVTRTLANDFAIAGATSWGQDSTSGSIILNGAVDFSAGARNTTINSDTVWAGVTSNGGLNKLGAGTLTLRGAATWMNDSEVRDGTLILDGTALSNSQSFRPDCSIGLRVARLVITNGASVTIYAEDSNVRSGYNANVPATNIYDIAGVVTMPAATNGQGKMILGSGCARGIINLWPGADVEVASVIPADVNDRGDSELNLWGGTLRAKTNTTSFMQGLTEANVQDGGAVFHTAGFDISVVQPLLGAGAGGLTKNGLGTLTLLGTNTFSGASTAREGRLVVSTAHAGGGAFGVADGAALAVKVAFAGSTLRSAAVSFGESSGGMAEFLLGSGNATAAVLYATNLATHGTVTINVAGVALVPGQFPLIQYEGAIGGNGFAAFSLGALPAGVSAALVDNPAHSVDLRIDSVAPLRWAGDINGDWDLGFTANWRIGATASTYDEVFGSGPAVRFDDGAVGTTAINLVTNVAPASIVVSNQALSYTLGGLGKVVGGGQLLKQGLGTLILATPGEYAGNTVIEAGKLALGAWDVLPDGVGKGDVIVNGTLDLVSVMDTINGLSGSGTVENSGGGTATLSIGTNGASTVFTGTVAGSIAINKVGSGTLTLGTRNTHSGGSTITAGKLFAGHNEALGSGLVSLSGGLLASDSSAPRTLNNALLITTASTLGDATNTGALTLTGAVDLFAGARNVTVQSDVVWSGVSTNGRLNKLGPGTLFLKGSADWNGDAEIRNGVLILDGGRVTNSGALRPDCDQAYGSARMVVSNGTVLVLTTVNANLRAGYDGEITSTNFLDVASTVRMPNAVDPDGRLIAGRAGTRGIVTLLPGADIEVRNVAPASPAGYGEIYLNGGIIRAMTNRSDFIQGLDLVAVKAGGVTLDSGPFQVEVSQPLLDGGGLGTVEKTGTGVLWLNGTNTYRGTTLVTAGTLGGSGAIAGPVNVSSAGSLAPGAPFGTLVVSNTVTLGGSTVMEISKTGALLSSDLLSASTLNCGGVLVVTNIGPDALAEGDTFKLFEAASFSGAFAGFVLPDVPGFAWDTSRVAVDGTLRVKAAPPVPRFTTYSYSGSALILGGTGGTPGATYYVLASTNVSLPLPTWTPVQTNVFESDGKFSATLPVDLAVRARFFQLLVP